MTLSKVQQKIVLAAALILLTLLSYFPVFSNGFVYDDHFQLLGNPFIKELRNIPTIFTTDVWHFSRSTLSNNYRPLHLLTYLIVYRFFGPNAFYFHAVNFLLHLACVFLLWWIGQHHLKEIPAFLAALLFATHPIHVEPVAWIGGVPEVLHAALLLAAYVFFLRQKILYCVLFFTAALFAKEPALMFPAVLLLDQMLYRRYPRKKWLITVVACLLAIAFYLALRFYAIGGFLRPSQLKLSALDTLYTAISFAGLYLQKVMLPLNLKVFYYFSLPLPPASLLAGSAILAAALLLVLLSKNNKPFLFGFGWFAIFLGPALLVTGVSAVLFAERYAYLPSAGLLLALVSIRIHRVAAVFLCLLALIFALISMQRSQVWHNDQALWKQAVLDSPGSAIATYNLATAHFERKEWAAAARYYQRTVELEPKRVEAYYGLAACQHALGADEDAMKNLDLFLRHWRGDESIRTDALKKMQELRQQQKD